MSLSSFLHTSDLLPIGHLWNIEQHIVQSGTGTVFPTSCHDDRIWQRNSTKTISSTWKRLLKIPSLASFNKSFSGGSIIIATSYQKHPLHIIIVEVATTMPFSPLIQLWKILYPSIG